MDRIPSEFWRTIGGIARQHALRLTLAAAISIVGTLVALAMPLGVREVLNAAISRSGGSRELSLLSAMLLSSQ